MHELSDDSRKLINIDLTSLSFDPKIPSKSLAYDCVKMVDTSKVRIEDKYLLLTKLILNPYSRN